MWESIRTWGSRVWAWARMRRLDDDFRSELEAHAAMLADDYIRGGLTPEEARRKASARLGGLTQLRESYREQRGVPLFDRLAQDARYAVRMFRKSPGFTLFAGGTLALGIAATTSVFSVAHTVLLRPFAYRDASRLAIVWQDDTAYGFPRNNASPFAFEQWRTRNRAFDGMAALSQDSLNLTGRGDPEYVRADTVTSNFFAVLGVDAHTGRTFTPDDGRAAAPRTAVMSYSLWLRRFAADPKVIGRDVVLNDAAYTVIGIMPPGFRFLDAAVDVWVPAQWTPALVESRKSDHFLTIVGRLRAGITVERANAEMRVLGRQLATAAVPDLTAVVVPLREQIAGDIRPALLLLVGAVAFVLIVACANIANLLLVRGSARNREIAVRVALGASRRRVVEQMLVESLLLSAAAGAAGLGLSVAVTRFLGALVPPGVWGGGAPVVDRTLLAFTVTVSMATGVLFGILPAVRASRVRLAGSLKQGGGRSGAGTGGRLLRPALVVGEIALATILLAGAALMIRSFENLYRQDPGFRAERVLTLRTPLPRPKYQDAVRRRAFYRAVLERVEALPGVSAAGYTTYLPLANAGGGSLVTVENRREDPEHFLIANVRVVSPGYFRAVGMTLRHGRLVDRADGPDAAKIAVVNETMAATYWPGKDAIGRRFKRGFLASQSPWYTVVGIVADMRQGGMKVPVRPEAYFPFEQADFFAPDSLAVRTAVDPSTVARQVREEVRAVDKDQPVAAVMPLQQLVDADVSPARVQTLLLGGFAGIALLLAALGLYGVLSFAVAQRTQEIGVRVALGATRADVLRIVVKHGLRLFLLGGAIGLPAALAVSRLMAHLLFGVTAADPLSYLSVTLVLAVVTLLACYVPARRAILLDPIEALRCE